MDLAKEDDVSDAEGLKRPKVVLEVDEKQGPGDKIAEQAGAVPDVLAQFIEIDIGKVLDVMNPDLLEPVDQVVVRSLDEAPGAGPAVPLS